MNREEKSYADWTNQHILEQINREKKIQTACIQSSNKESIWSHHTKREHFFGFCLEVFLQAEQPQRVGCLPPMGNKPKVFFARKQQRIASSRIKPGVRNLSITTPTIYHRAIVANRSRRLQRIMRTGVSILPKILLTC